ncbi:MAG: prenyltransferase [Thermoplasmata archaeon]
MSGKKPGILEMAMAPFLFAIIVPLTISTSLSVHIKGEFDIIGFIFAWVIGISLHVTTNVYNDIYDTKQGSDTSKSSKNEFSGGSGILIKYPDMEKNMFDLARSGIAIGFISILGLLYISKREIWPLIATIYLVSVFFSKYYTAEPFKFAYRGLGEIVVWIGFGPLAILLGAIGQGVFFHPYIISIMPITGLSTLFIVWMGEMVDLPGDLEAGKKGLVARLGLKRGLYGHMFIHLLALLNVTYISYLIGPLTPIWIAVIPHIFLLPKIYLTLEGGLGERKVMKRASRLNFTLFFLFSLFLMAGFILQLFI